MNDYYIAGLRSLFTDSFTSFDNKCSFIVNGIKNITPTFKGLITHN